MARPKALQRKNPSRTKSNEYRQLLNRRKSYYQPEEFANREFPLVYKPKVIKKVGDYCYVFHCTVKGNSGSRFNKNMSVLVEGDDLSVINPLRLTEEGEEKLMELAPNARVARIIRLGPSEHAAFEDDYYLQRFEGCERWAPGPFSCSPHLPLHQRLWDTTNTATLSLDAPISPPSPHPNVMVFVFAETVEPESLIYLVNKRTVIAGDCLQHQVDNPFVNDGGFSNLQKNGLLAGKVVLSEKWVASQCVVTNNSRKLNNSFKTRAQKAKSFFGNGAGKFKLKADFQRLLQLRVDRLTSTSGNHVLHEGDDMPELIAEAVDRVCGHAE